MRPPVGHRTARLLTGLALAALLLLTACANDASGAFVTRAGASLSLDGRPFRFVGVNLYDAAATDIYTCSPATRLTDRELDQTMRALADRGASVVRFWAYQTYTAGATDFSGVDRVITAARDAGLRVMPVLEDGPGNCTTGEPGVAKAALPGDRWYVDGYRSPYGSAPLSFRDYAVAMAEHYADEPTILAWTMVNEAETAARDERDRSALVAFAADVGARIRAVDPNHLITLGTQANGAFGTSGRDVTDIYSLPVLDLVEVHDWGRYGSDTEPLPGSLAGGTLPDPRSDACTALDAKIACSFARAAALGKPLVVGEVGIEADDAAGRQRRATLLRAKANAALAAGADGYLLWHLSTADTDGYDLLLSRDDPSLQMLAEVSRGLG